MLSNKDFAALVEKSDFSKDNKVRFDLKQISEWDKQNNAKFKRKSNNKSYNREDNSESQSNKQKFASLYRDRANERRKDIKNEGDQAIEEMVAKLDAEQTKFLGGDIEHTHLVKGLDYVLLKKIRGEGTSSLNEFAEQEAASTIVVNDDTKAPHDIVIESSLGQAVNRVLFGHELRNLNEKKMKNPGLLLRRCAFEFDLDPLSEADVPTMISRSKLDYNYDESMNFAIGTKVIDSITRLLDLKLSSRKKRRRQKDDGTEITDHGDGMGHMDVEPSLKVITSSNSKSFSNAKMITNDFDDIYGGIVDNVGKYVAVGALDDDQAETTKLSSITPSNHLSAKNIFSDTMDVKDQPPVHAMGAQDLLAPVKAVLRAQSMKEKNVLANAAAALQSQDNKKGNAASRIGDFLSASSSYDFYPDMNNYEMDYDSDDDPAPGKKSSNTNKNQTSTTNRAARRAAARQS